MSATITMDWYRKFLNRNLFLPRSCKRSEIVLNSADLSCATLASTTRPKGIGVAAISGIICVTVGTVLIVGFSIFFFLQKKKKKQKLRKKDSEKDLVVDQRSSTKSSDKLSGDGEHPTQNFSPISLSFPPTTTTNPTFLSTFQPPSQHDLNIFPDALLSSGHARRLDEYSTNNEPNDVPLAPVERKESLSRSEHRYKLPQIPQSECLIPLSEELGYLQSSSDFSLEPRVRAECRELVPKPLINLPINSKTPCDSSSALSYQFTESNENLAKVPTSDKSSPFSTSLPRSLYSHQTAFGTQVKDHDRESPVLGISHPVKINREPHQMRQASPRLTRKTSDRSGTSSDTFEQKIITEEELERLGVGKLI